MTTIEIVLVVAALGLAAIIGAVIGSLYVVIQFGKRLIRHNYVCTQCGDSFRKFIMGDSVETTHAPKGEADGD